MPGGGAAARRSAQGGNTHMPAFGASDDKDYARLMPCALERTAISRDAQQPSRKIYWHFDA